MKTIFKIYYDGLDLEIVGEYTRGMKSRDRLTPDDDPEFELQEIILEGFTLWELSAYKLSIIKPEVVDKISADAFTRAIELDGENQAEAADARIQGERDRRIDEQIESEV